MRMKLFCLIVNLPSVKVVRGEPATMEMDWEDFTSVQHIMADAGYAMCIQSVNSPDELLIVEFRHMNADPKDALDALQVRVEQKAEG